MRRFFRIFICHVKGAHAAERIKKKTGKEAKLHTLDKSRNEFPYAKEVWC